MSSITELEEIGFEIKGVAGRGKYVVKHEDGLLGAVDALEKSEWEAVDSSWPDGTAHLIVEETPRVSVIQSKTHSI